MHSINKKTDFMRSLNFSYKAACLQCSLSDKEIGEYFQHMKSTSDIPKKTAVRRVGLQPDGTWILSRNVYVSSQGEVVSAQDSSYIWIGHLYDGPGVARDNEECLINLPLSSDPLNHLLCQLKAVLKHNFMPCVLVMASAVLAMHYESMIKKLHFCPIAIAFGDPGTGKTTALQASMAILGAIKSRFYSKITPAKILQLCATSGIPLAVDDPQSKAEISRLMIDLYNGASNATVVRGALRPASTCVISANFTTIEELK